MAAADPFSDFSKGSVRCKYKLVRPRGGVRKREGVGCLSYLVWAVIWLALPPIRGYQMINACMVFVPFFFGRRLFRWFHRYEEVGLLTIAGHTMEFAVQGEEPWRVDLRELRSMTVSLSMPADFVQDSNVPALAYRISIQRGEKLHEYHALENMYLTQEDMLQFMSPPPPLSVTLATMRERFGLRYYDLKGRESSLV